VDGDRVVSLVQTPHEDMEEETAETAGEEAPAETAEVTEE